MILKTENINKLSTKEDNYHFHKTIGILSLINYVYRYFNLFLYQDMLLNNTTGLFFISLHGILSLSSMIFHIPKIRNKSSPMIYPEFRLHSICFALRSVCCCYSFYFNMPIYYNIGICFTTMIAADIITHYNKSETTMRSMPFSNNILENEKNEIVQMQSNMQMYATLFMVLNINTAFSPMFAIQLAAFLMTLVRKNIIDSTTWHGIYNISLWMNTFLFLTLLPSDLLQINNCNFIFKKLRFANNVNKYVAWSIVFIFYLYTKNEINNNEFIVNYIDNNKYCVILFRYGALSHFWYTYLCKFNKLFITK